ncbi:DUF7144 family membrane protein [Actinospica durhamensis]|uniref:DUF7144 family membrane protein n=1 Tax=Actinospica durhamensis TaxID=1508375 RepID=UPI001FE6E698|nr:hypothetical protein [Actinospica durhamensis]
MASNTDGPARYAPREQEDSLRPMATGWTVFAAVLMFFGGVMAVLQGITAIAKDNLIVVTHNYAYTFNVTSWGWIHLILGALIAVAGLALFTGATWARFVGIAVAGLGMIANFLWLPYYPFWAILLIFIDVAVIWALCAGMTRRAGREY